MIHLAAHLDTIAALRHLGGGRAPALVGAAHAAVLGGADWIGLTLGAEGIAEDDVAHVQDALGADVWLNVPVSEESVQAAVRLKPSAVCLVRDASLRSAGGLDLASQAEATAVHVGTLRDAGLPVALSVAPEEEALLAAGTTGAETLVLHTGSYGRATVEAERLRRHLELARAALSAKQLGHRVHVGGGLDYTSVLRVAALPEVEVVHAGFALASRAVFEGMTGAVRRFRYEMLRARELSTAGQ